VKTERPNDGVEGWMDGMEGRKTISITMSEPARGFSSPLSSLFVSEARHGSGGDEIENLKSSFNSFYASAGFCLEKRK
jgi:hypothetical protein